MEQIVLFDYDGLDSETRIVVQQEDKEFDENMHDAGTAFSRACVNLYRIHQALRYKRPGFVDYCKSKPRLSQPVANRMVNVGKMLVESTNIPQIQSKEILYLLASDSTPDEVKEWVIEETEKGNEPQHIEVKSRIETHKAPRDEPVVNEPWDEPLGDAVVFDDVVEQRAQERAKQILAEQEQARKAKKAAHDASIEAQRKAINEGVVTMPSGLFDVLVLDPPWAYGREYDPETSRVANPYPEMTQDELLAIDLPAKDDSVLFLWTTHKFLWDAKALLDHWGFTCKATLVWDKELIGMGAWVRMQCEFCLVGIKGKPFWNNTSWRDIIREQRREHSRKPDMFYRMVGDITAGRKLDYFSREQREGWEVYGNETDKF